MSTTALHYPSIDLLGYTGASSQDHVKAILAETAQHFQSPATRQQRGEAIASVVDAFAASHRAEDQEPVSEATCNEVIGFLRTLPPTIPIPEVVLEPDGGLGLEWYLSKYHSFVLSFSGKSVMTYAGLFGRGRTAYGTEFLSEGVPSSITYNIRRALLQS